VHVLFVLFEMLIAEHLDASFTALEIATAVYGGVIVITWAVALLHPDKDAREWASGLLKDLLTVPQAVARFLADWWGKG
jgi:hypothetical protein